MYLVSDILRTKGHDVWSIHADATVYEALQMMADKDVGALVVIDKGQVVGIFSERDYARKVILAGLSSLNTPVKQIMSTGVYYVTPDQSIEECMAVMTKNRVRHLPVIVNEQLVGLVSIGDAVKSIISDQDIQIRQFENYISGRGYSADPLQL